MYSVVDFTICDIGKSNSGREVALYTIVCCVNSSVVNPVLFQKNVASFSASFRYPCSMQSEADFLNCISSSIA